jgi:cobalamin biosynthesis Mg chelatase CobN
MGYTNINSVANRFRALRAKYGFTSLESKMTKSTPLKEKAAPRKDNGKPTKRGRGKPVQDGTPTKGSARKGAKVSTATPVPATGPVVKEETVVKNEYGDGEESEDNAVGKDSSDEGKLICMIYVFRFAYYGRY